MNKTRNRKQITPFHQLSLRKQWQRPKGKKLMVGCLKTFGQIRNPEEIDGQGD